MPWVPACGSLVTGEAGARAWEGVRSHWLHDHRCPWCAGGAQYMSVVPLCLYPVSLPPTLCCIYHVSATFCPSRPVPLCCPSSSWLLEELWRPTHLNCIFLWVLERATCRTGSCLGLVRGTESAGGQEKEVVEEKGPPPGAVCCPRGKACPGDCDWRPRDEARPTQLRHRGERGWSAAERMLL